MIELFVLLALFGGLWLFVSVIGLVFKLVFGLIGGVFSLIGGLFAIGIGLVLLPFLALAMLPFLFPVLLLIGVIWMVSRSAQRHEPAQATH